MIKYILPTFQNITQKVKSNNDFKQKRMTLYGSKKSINIITRSNVKTQW